MVPFRGKRNSGPSQQLLLFPPRSQLHVFHLVSLLIILLILLKPSIINSHFWLSSRIWGFIHAPEENERETETLQAGQRTVPCHLHWLGPLLPSRGWHGVTTVQVVFLKSPGVIVESALSWHQAGFTFLMGPYCAWRAHENNKLSKDS